MAWRKSSLPLVMAGLFILVSMLRQSATFTLIGLGSVLVWLVVKNIREKPVDVSQGATCPSPVVPPLPGFSVPDLGTVFFGLLSAACVAASVAVAVTALWLVKPDTPCPWCVVRSAPVAATVEAAADKPAGIADIVKRTRALVHAGKIDEAVAMAEKARTRDGATFRRLAKYIRDSLDCQGLASSLEDMVETDTPTQAADLERYACRMHAAYKRENAWRPSKGFQDGENAWGQAYRDAVFERVKKIPASKPCENMAGYGILKRLDPENALFADKYRRYREKCGNRPRLENRKTSE